MRGTLTLLYGALFVVVLPLLLVFWSRRLDVVLSLPAIGSPAAGLALAGAGLLLMIAATQALWARGHGLPMSPFPPVRLVTSGAYRWMSHPIYTGAVIACAGFALASSSAAGVFVVTPIVALAALAFVAGYERDATRERFGRLPHEASPAFHLRGWTWCWTKLCRGAERIANSWGEATVGRVRFLSHGIYAAAGAFVGTLIATMFGGEELLWWIVAMALGAQIGAAVWAQVVEGSPRLLRPFGYFGSAAAVVAIAIAAEVSGASGWRLAAAFSIGACFTQAIGRLRCLVQGCCHGRPVDAAWGIRVTHPRSRIVRLSKFGGVPLHPTQLYSIVAALVLAAILIAFWFARMPLPFITGMYFLLTGLERFAEEHFRGEPQTPAFGGLRLYQWLAIAFVVGGAAATAMSGARAGGFGWRVEGWPVLAALAVVTYVAYGVDFPGSSRRLARLV
jgi:prolipoprotein diacylglyceryltransferase/protein-S-isoprenylcysteine O-methyltransferase Ste14